ncbi:4659_t:CDS:2 [Funneliformis geosporum]|uniref:4659_t:CDS:1 n=1 Tax=Funneliformis geosporum TaxID=1117311 RepID=A0A9W4SGD0_9GLOM|nr:4659_t:CDS:2 [Funneliformis geosporum]
MDHDICCVISQLVCDKSDIQYQKIDFLGIRGVTQKNFSSEPSQCIIDLNLPNWAIKNEYAWISRQVTLPESFFHDQC